MNDTIKSIATIMKDLDGILIFPHMNMDGDALGSSTALCLALRSLGKKAYVMINEPVPKNLDFLECGCTTNDDSVLDDVQLSVMVDCNGLDRIQGREEVWKRGRLKGCIDHHATKAKDMRYDFSRVEPKSAAAGEIIYNIIKALGVTIDLDMANAIFTAITTDTGNFQHSNTTSRSHEIAGHLYKIEGFNSKAISALIYDRRSKNAIRMESKVLENLNFYADGKLVVGRVTQDLLRECECTMDEADGIIQKMMSIDGVEGACLFKETDHSIRASLRGRSYANMEKAAAKYGGGGHMLAAGCSFYAPMPEVEELFIPELIEAVSRTR
ncbi:MAG: bifunctional oligoribonuclease/PAP phosphatase NrnA [Clostridiales bacterium]|nr:bifunctional oligoribonuclease/PAP phosphatase NrnA [Clostridiales bacterium]